jgi:hypothetical protein
MGKVISQDTWVAKVQRECPIYPKIPRMTEFKLMYHNESIQTDSAATEDDWGVEYLIEDDGIILWVTLNGTYHNNTSGQCTHPYIDQRVAIDNMWVVAGHPPSHYAPATVGETPWMEWSLHFPGLFVPVMRDDVLKCQYSVCAANAAAGGYASFITSIGMLKEP